MFEVVQESPGTREEAKERGSKLGARLTLRKAEPNVDPVVTLKSPVRRNNFGILRVLFAIFVIVSHSPEIIDGNNSREIFTRLFGSMSFGEVAVDGFFLVSGYLITKSFAERPELWPYLIKRIARIVPAYFVSFWLCVFVLAPLGHADSKVFSLHGIFFNVRMNLLLQPPVAPAVFRGLPLPFLNGSMWTISYEFRCYLLVPIVAAVARLLRISVSKMRWGVLALTFAGLLANSMLWAPAIFAHDVRFVAVFGAGALFYLFREKIPLNGSQAAASALLLVAGLRFHRLAEVAVAIFGGYLISWFALKVRAFKVGELAARNDISYGVYLYAWPIQILLVWHHPAIHPWLVSVLAVIGASIAGFASWHLLEKKILNWAHERVAKPAMEMRPV
jgi:peptidoglycan/LPS O-acetylase OafA/YrhL